ncbi:hypothetical protein XENORESO_010049 [Xenotaenia resolanae]|uniref:Uncharacterized protein n=1 Tax=Xenotaenia resolanae TaxID=208358 RepID=A0ABV0X078_9TELE
MVQAMALMDISSFLHGVTSSCKSCQTDLQLFIFILKFLERVVLLLVNIISIFIVHTTVYPLCAKANTWQDQEALPMIWLCCAADSKERKLPMFVCVCVCLCV